MIYGGLSGRFDQTIHTLHALYKLRKVREWAWIVSEDSLSCVLDEVGGIAPLQGYVTIHS